MRGADILVQMLIGYGVETIFGVPGDTNVPFMKRSSNVKVKSAMLWRGMNALPVIWRMPMAVFPISPVFSSVRQVRVLCIRCHLSLNRMDHRYLLSF